MADVSSWSLINWHFIAGGLGLFLFGVKIMGDSLTKFAGTKIRDYIEKYTSNTIMDIIVGVVIVLSGLSMWKPVQLHWLVSLVGGYDFARYVHFTCMALIVAFLVIHVALALLVPKSLRAMIIGR